MARFERPRGPRAERRGRRAVVTSDWHLSAYGSWRGRGIRGDAAWGVQQVLDYARDARNGVAEVFVLGDNWEMADVDHPDTPALQARIRALLARPDTPPVNYVLGNHDRGADWFQVPGLEHVRHIQGRCTVLGHSAFASDYQGRADLRRMIDAIPDGTELFLGHQSCLQFQGSDNSDLDLHDLAVRGISIALLGDYHSCRTAEVPGLLGVSPGPVCVQAIDEETAKGFFVLEESPTGLLVESIGILTREVRSVECASAEDIDEVLEDARGWVSACVTYESRPSEVRAPILVIRMLTGCPDPRPAFEAAFAGSAHLFTRRVARERVDLGPRRGSSWAATWDEALVRRGASDEVRDLTRRLLTATDLRGELRRAREEATCG